MMTIPISSQKAEAGPSWIGHDPAIPAADPTFIGLAIGNGWDDFLGNAEKFAVTELERLGVTVLGIDSRKNQPSLISVVPSPWLQTLQSSVAGVFPCCNEMRGCRIAHFNGALLRWIEPES